MWSDMFSLGISKKGVNEDNSYEDDNIEVVDENYNFQGVNQAALARHLLSPPSPSGQQVLAQTSIIMNAFMVNQKQNLKFNSGQQVFQTSFSMSVFLANQKQNFSMK